jgi:hypothetical protein
MCKCQIVQIYFAFVPTQCIWRRKINTQKSEKKFKQSKMHFIKLFKLLRSSEM